MKKEKVKRKIRGLSLRKKEKLVKELHQFCDLKPPLPKTFKIKKVIRALKMLEKNCFKMRNHSVVSISSSVNDFGEALRITIKILILLKEQPYD